MRILVAEDNAASRRMLVRLLVRWGHEVVACQDGQEALEKLQSRDAPRLAILDRQMPRLDGTDVCRRLRSGKVVRPLHLVLLTALGEKKDVIEGLESGADDYLTKPIDARELRARLAAWSRGIGAAGDEPAAADEPPAIDMGPEETVIDPVKTAPRRRSARSLEGEVVADKYEVLATLGSGGMGVVYKARHTLLDEVVALKVVHDSMSDRPDVRERFLREAKAAMQFVHRNAIPVRDFGVASDGTLFMTLGYSNGKSLRVLAGETGRMSVPRALALVRQCLLALDEAHGHGIVHRDLKPENILVETAADGTDLPRICDFGMAKLRASAESAGTSEITGHSIVGTPHYMAPEQASGDTVDHRADLYALGCVLYELVTGTKVFSADTASQILMKHVTQSPEAPSKRAPGIPRALETLLLRVLAKAPDARPQTASEMIVAIDEIAGSPLPLSRPLNILLAEDNVVNQRLTLRMLEKHGHEVAIAANGQEALALLERSRFDVVLMDGDMPVMDGFDATRRIRARERELGRRTPIVALTGLSDERDRQRCLAEGMDEHVAKPVDARALLEAVAKVVRNARERPSASEAIRRAGRTFDASVALARVEGDADLFREVASMFVTESRRLVVEIRDAIAVSNAVLLGHSAHELRGAAANCSANVVASLAGELEALASRGELGDAPRLVSRLQAELDEVHPAILSVLQGVPNESF